jgi:putative FmdB family regulatory protein
LPLYEYQCQSCKAYFEKIQKFSDPPLRKCERCGGKLERLLSSPAIQFKGSGWYVTDYARKASPETNKGSAEPAAKSSEGKSDAGAKAGESAKGGENGKTGKTTKPSETSPAHK